MIAIDTNLLVRFLVVDDLPQAEKVRTFFKTLEANKDRCFVSDAVILELIWVLESAYDYSREEIAKALEALAQLDVLKLQSDTLLPNVCQDIRTTGLEPSDALISRLALQARCDHVLTFDKRAAGHPSFRLMP